MAAQLSKNLEVQRFDKQLQAINNAFQDILNQMSAVLRAHQQTTTTQPTLRLLQDETVKLRGFLEAFDQACDEAYAFIEQAKVRYMISLPGNQINALSEEEKKILDIQKSLEKFSSILSKIS